jgi:curved DNA-binding protein CbpA
MGGSRQPPVTEERDPYTILGVPRNATDSMIREAYRERARQAHPDLVGEAGLDQMRVLNEAWAILKDPGRRADYDAEHAQPAPASGSSTPSEPRRGGAFAGQPAWTGAAGAPPGRPWGHVLDFGIYAGWSIGEVGRRDRGYLTWLRDRPESKKFRHEIEIMLAPRTGEDGGQGRSERQPRRGR